MFFVLKRRSCSIQWSVSVSVSVFRFNHKEHKEGTARKVYPQSCHAVKHLFYAIPTGFFNIFCIQEPDAQSSIVNIVYLIIPLYVLYSLYTFIPKRFHFKTPSAVKVAFSFGL